MTKIFNELYNTQQFKNVFNQLDAVSKKKWYICYLDSEWRICFKENKITFDWISRDHRDL